MAQEDANEGWYRRKIGRRIEMGANNLLGMLLGAIGVVALLVTLGSDSFTLATHWPSLLFAGVFLFLARLCFRAKKGIIEEIGEGAESYVAPRSDNRD